MPSSEYFYQEYPCLYNAPLNCDRPCQTAQEIPGAKFCMQYGFLAILPQEAKIPGNRGTYQVIDTPRSKETGILHS